MHAPSLQSCPTLCNPMDSSPPGSSVHGILQARILEWVAISFIFPTQESNPGLPHCRQTLWPLSHQGSNDSLIWMELNRIYLKFPSCKLVESIMYRVFSHIVKLVIVVKNLPFNTGDVRDAGSIPGWGRSPGRTRQPTPLFLPGESHEQRSLAGYSP